MAFLIGVISIIFSVLMISLRYQICGIFNDDEEVIEIAQFAMIISAASFIFDTGANIAKYIILAMGKQKQAAYIYFGAQWLIVIPISAVWVFYYGKGLEYILGTKLVGSLCCCLGNVLAIICTDWDKLIQTIQDRLKKST